MWLSTDPLAEQMPNWSPYLYTFNNPVRLIDPTGMVPEDWIKQGNRIFYDAAVNGTFEARSKYGSSAQSITGYHVSRNGLTADYDLGKDGSIGISRGALAFLNHTTSVYSTGNIETGGATIEGWGGQRGSQGATITSPNPMYGKSHFDYVMVETNPLMPLIAGVVSPPLGFLSGVAQTFNDFSEGNYVGGVIGGFALGASSKFGSKFVHGEYKIMTNGLPKDGKFQYGIRNTETNFQFRLERHRLQTAGGGEKAVHFNYGTEGSKHFFPVNASKYRPYVRQ
ncbi:hypothetical protein GNY06_04045 [Elizabethkingia argentiflava]|uniref:RHS repeat-associated core domain-containing protein n=1 Tax=Elizabethkingia argenteiflava TaxID=2681556 RepID=A0A845PQL6_9FLAO|nr:hypothetical protein [Elizabethkingia argenteiflava]NAW50589.1 hypothetical protein [Elizabethkingia argenteiflava]